MTLDAKRQSAFQSTYSCFSAIHISLPRGADIEG